MLTVKQIFEFALRCAIQDHEDMLIKHKNFIMAKKYKQDVDEIMDALINLDKKENYIASSNPATETAVLFALNLKEGEVQELKAAPQQTKKFPPEYMVQLELVKDSKRGSGISKKFYSTLEEANKEFLGWKTANENMNCYSVRLCKKIGEGKYKVLTRSLPKDRTASQSQEFAPLYEVRIIHLTGKVQVLKFDILKAAESTFELLKYELEVNRIHGASVVETIPGVGFRKELHQIGARYSERCK